MVKALIEKLRKEFSFLKKDAMAVLLFGSSAKEGTGRDKDICVVAPKTKSEEVLKKVFGNIDVTGKKYDVYAFEELPLYMKWQVINNHKVVWALDEGDLYEYFYYFRKLEAEQKHRMEISKEEILAMF